MKIFNLEFLLPKKNKIAILDNAGSSLIRNTIKQKNLPIITIRKNNKINILIFFYSLFQSYKYSKGQRYIIAYIKYLKPKIIISHIDNNNFFFSLKKIFSKIKFVFIQNGTGIADFTEMERKKFSWYSDFFFSYSNQFSKIYSKFLKSKFYTIGSFKNNFLKINKKIKKKRIIVFISQYRTSSNNISKKNIIYIYNNKKFPLEIFYKAEKILIPILYKFCKKKKYKLVIAGSNFDRHSILREKNFYLDILKNCYSKFDKKFYQYKKLKNEFSSYNLIDSSSLVVFIDSALGYQSLARNNKTLACSFRSHFVKNKNLCFGWPSKFAKEGPFWTNYYNLNRLNNKLSNLMKMSNSTWRKIYKKYDKDLLIYNSGNELFKDCLRKLN
tara:strand:- start:2315 stop:3466 length:1152 start_codon:yes stop_codon:yes gene_type:complete